MRRVGCFLGLIWMLAAPAWAQGPPTSLRMQNVAKAFVQSTGQQIIGLGSWISGANYQDVLRGGASDHDLRLVIQNANISPAQAQREWQAARRTLSRLVEQEFGKDAPKVLGSINLYPPNQLMRGVENAGDAFERFQKLGQVPNLAHRGAVTASTSRHLAEGLYGEGAKVWTQMYEQRAGRLFYQANGKAYAGMVDLTHLAEGRARYTLRGMANTSGQWVEHALEELGQGRGDRVAKYLERLERDLSKAKDLARLGGDSVWAQEIRELTQTLRRNPQALSQLEGRVGDLLRRSHLESAILARLERSGPLQQAVLRSALGGLAARDEFGRLLSQALEKIPTERLVQGLAAIALTYSTSRIAGEQGALEAIRQNAPFLLNLPAGALAGLTNAVLDAARQGGFNLAAGSQEPWDLLEGIFSAGGRESSDEGRAYTIDDLVRNVRTEERLAALVFARARQAASRGFGGAATGGDDERVAEAIFARCFPTILQAWRARREALFSEYAELADRLHEVAFLMTATPQPATLPPGGRVRVATEVLPPQDSTFGRDLDRMQEILAWLEGGRPYSLVSYRWPAGQEGGRESQRVFTFDQPGTHGVLCRIEVVVNASQLAAGHPLIQRFELFSAVDVVVQREVKEPPRQAPPPLPPPAPATATPPRTAAPAPAGSAGPVKASFSIAQIYVNPRFGDRGVVISGDLSSDYRGTGGGAAGGTFPGELFNGLQISGYSVSGAELDAPQDSTGFTHTRRYKGRITGKTLTVSGSTTELYGKCNTEYGSFKFVLQVKVTVNGVTKEYRSPEPCAKPAGTPQYEVKQGAGAFSVTVTAP